MDSETDHVAALAERFWGVYQAAGRPTLATVVNAVQQRRVRSRLSDSTLSGWLRGKAVPSDAALFRAVVEYLLDRTPDFQLRSLPEWERLRAVAETQKNSRRGRPSRSPTPAESSTFGLPRPPTQPFTGRKAELAQLDCEGRRPGTRITVIHGLSGTGKTELALQYAVRHRDRHPVVWWTAADTAEAIAAGLARMARRLTKQPSGAAEVELTEWAIRWLQEHDRWLLILDDVDSRTTVEDALGGIVRGHILITTRRDLSWGGLAHESLHLRPLEPEASHELLSAYCPAADADQLNELADDMGHLPLALHQAAAYIQQSRTSVATYLARLRSQPVKALTTTAYGDPSERAIGRVLAITVETVEQQNPFAITILGILACYAPDNIPRGLLVHPDEFAIDGALAALASFNLIALRADTISVHRLVQIFVNEHLRQSANSCGCESCDCEDIDPENSVPRPLDVTLELAFMLLNYFRPKGNPQSEVDAWPRWSALAPHVDAFLTHIPAEDASEGVAALAGDMALFHSVQGNPGRALDLSQYALRITELNLGPDAVEVAIQLDNVAGALWNLGRNAEVEPLQRRAVQICEADPDRSHLVIRLDNLAHTLHRQGRLEEAERLQRRALSIAEESISQDDPEYAATLNSLAITLTSQGRPLEAEPLLRQALAINESHLGPSNPRVADNLDNLGITLRKMHRAADAEPFQRRALLITEQLLGETHPAVAVRLSNLAATMQDLGHIDTALLMERRALDIHLRNGRPDHPDVATSLVNLAAVLTDSGVYLEAESHLRRALEIDSHVFDANHPRISVTLTNLALCLADIDRTTEAEKLLHQALYARIAHFGEGHTQVALSYIDLARLMNRIGRPDQARPHQTRAAAIVEAALGADHPATTAALDDLIKILIDLDLLQEAELLLRRTLNTAKAQLGASHPDLAMRIHTLVQVLQDQGRLQEARELVRQALSISESAYGPAHQDVAVGLNNLAIVTSKIEGHAAAEPILRKACDIARTLEGNPEMYAELRQNLDDCLTAIADHGPRCSNRQHTG